MVSHSIDRKTSSMPKPSAIFALVLLAVAILLALPEAAKAQPYDTYLGLAGHPAHGYVRIPHSPSLNPTGAFTFEAWIRLTDNAGCSSIAGKNFTQAWWIGICGTTLRSYLKGIGSSRDAGGVPTNVWTHVAVTFDGTQRRHYIDGELVGTFAETGPLTTSTSEMRIGSDVALESTPTGRIDEVRIWYVARTQAQLRSAINVPIGTAEAGLVSVWRFQFNFEDIIRDNDGSAEGSGVAFFQFADDDNCVVNTETALCLQNRFLIDARFRTGAPGTAEATAQTVAVDNPGSGLFWFFSPDNWEVMVKAIDGCGLNSHYWIFSAAATNVFYRLEAFDLKEGKQKIYFNYPGPPALAVTDTSAFATCP